MRLKSILATSFVLFILFFGRVYAQNSGLSGLITDPKKLPLPFSGVFAMPGRQTTVANALGNYQLILPAGRHQITFQSLGYKPQTRTIEIADKWVSLDILLEQQTYTLGQVEVRVSDQNPAISIIQSAISTAPLHLTQAQSYTVMTYSKGSAKLTQVPWLLRGRLKKEGIDSNTVFSTEAVTQISFVSPNKYTERVIKTRTSGSAGSPDNNPIRYLRSSFYSPNVMQSISPLSPLAFRYYNFEYAGSFEERGQTIHKISVMPKKIAENLFEGYIWIVDNLWNLHSLELQNTRDDFATTIRQQFAPVDDHVWMPVAYRFDTRGKYLGIGLAGHYIATASGYKMVINPYFLANKKRLLPQIVSDTGQTNAAAQANQIAKQGTTTSPSDPQNPTKPLTKRALKRTIRQNERASQQGIEKSDVLRNDSLIIETWAHRPDSGFWQANRPVPLSAAEAFGTRKLDSMALANEKTRKLDSLNQTRYRPINLITGANLPIGKNKMLAVPSILSLVQYNTVEGLVFAPVVGLSAKDSSSGYYWRIESGLRYAMALERFSGKIRLGFAKANTNSFGIEAGRYMFQFSGLDALNIPNNSWNTLLYRINFLKIYEQDYLRLDYRHRLSPKVWVSIGSQIGVRRFFENQTDFSFFRPNNREFLPNAPINQELSQTGFDQHLAWQNYGSIVFRPSQKYYRFNGVETPARRPIGQFSLEMRQAIALRTSANMPDFLSLQGHWAQPWRRAGRILFESHLKAGFFAYSRRLYFMDFQHFAGNRYTVLFNSRTDWFRTLDYYNFSNNKAWLEAHLDWRPSAFLFTQNPKIRLLGWQEYMQSHTLYIPGGSNYQEIGYGISGISQLYTMEIVGAWQEQKWAGLRFRIAIELGR